MLDCPDFRPSTAFCDCQTHPIPGLPCSVQLRPGSAAQLEHALLPPGERVATDLAAGEHLRPSSKMLGGRPGCKEVGVGVIRLLEPNQRCHDEFRSASCTRQTAPGNQLRVVCPGRPCPRIEHPAEPSGLLQWARQAVYHPGRQLELEHRARRSSGSCALQGGRCERRRGCSPVRLAHCRGSRSPPRCTRYAFHLLVGGPIQFGKRAPAQPSGDRRSQAMRFYLAKPVQNGADRGAAELTPTHDRMNVARIALGGALRSVAIRGEGVFEELHCVVNEALSLLPTSSIARSLRSVLGRATVGGRAEPHRLLALRRPGLLQNAPPVGRRHTCVAPSTRRCAGYFGDPSRNRPTTPAIVAGLAPPGSAHAWRCFEDPRESSGLNPPENQAGADPATPALADRPPVPRTAPYRCPDRR
jgi:hypothetical protein